MRELFTSLLRALWFLVKVLIIVTVIRITAYQIGYREHIPVVDTVLFAMLQELRSLAYWMAGVLDSIGLLGRYIRGR